MVPEEEYVRRVLGLFLRARGMVEHPSPYVRSLGVGFLEDVGPLFEDLKVQGLLE